MCVRVVGVGACMCVRMVDDLECEWNGDHTDYLTCLLNSLIPLSLSDGLRSYFTVAFFTHISFAWSLICAFTVFLAGIELALQNRVSGTVLP